MPPSSPKRPFNHLRRLAPEWYQGHAAVHWTMTIDGRQTGWLSPLSHAQVREALLHTGHRYRLLCPVYCLMPDHAHFIWCGTAPSSDQRLASAFFRRCWNEALGELQIHGKRGTYRLQKQAHDHVLREEEREADAFQNACHYVLQNPLRAGLVAPAASPAAWPYTGCILPGYPRLHPHNATFWDRFWTIRQEVLEE